MGGKKGEGRVMGEMENVDLEDDRWLMRLCRTMRDWMDEEKKMGGGRGRFFHQ
jgi:hypothetical protein